ncbi:MAG: hypothetical protein ABJB86_15255 [Bacteroidota bacterium]
MFTFRQVKKAHAQVKSGADFPKYIQDMQPFAAIVLNQALKKPGS